MKALGEQLRLGASAPAGIDAWGLVANIVPGEVSERKSLVHTVLYAVSGVVHLSTKQGEVLVPPQHAVWIRAGQAHRIHATEPASLRLVLLSPGLLAAPEADIAVFQVEPLAREMILAASRWGRDRPAEDDRANRFFLAFAALCAEWVGRSRNVRIPKAKSVELDRAMRYATEHLQQEPTIEEAARVAGLSPRTLARRFREECGTTWREFLHDIRMFRAMELLADPDRSVTDTAHSVGFASLGAFTRAFVDFTGERPRDYHRRSQDD